MARISCKVCVCVCVLKGMNNQVNKPVSSKQISRFCIFRSTNPLCPSQSSRSWSLSWNPLQVFALCFQALLPLLISNNRAAQRPIGLGTAEARRVKGEVCEQGCLLREPEPWFHLWPGPAVTACGPVVLRSPSGPVRLSLLALLCLSLDYSTSMEPKLAAKAD